MKSILSLVSLLFIATVRANDMWRDSDAQSDTQQTSDSNIIKTGGLPPPGKAGYAAPSLPQLSGLPGTYAAYVTALGLGNPYAFGYNRYGLAPYSTYGYGAPAYSNYGYGNSVLPGADYSLGYGYGNPYYGRSSLSPYGYGYPGYAGLGYRYGGLGYGSSALKAPVVPAAAPVVNVPTNSVVNVPAPQVVNVPGQVAAVQASMPAIPASMPAYRGPVVATQNKDGSVSFTYAPGAGQPMTVY